MQYCYDANGETLTWTQGRRLATITNDSGTTTYTYDENGIRLSKSGARNTEYIVVDGKYLGERTTVSGREYLLTYLYGDSGVIGIERNGLKYFFVKNLQGDVTAIIDSSGDIVANYTYDAYGNVTSITSASGANIVSQLHIANLNPFRYRSYMYDQETGFYYLNSRYYDPAVGRFLNADVVDTISATPNELTDKNLFAYCDNNPVMRADNGGEFWHIVAGAVGGAFVGFASKLVTNAIEGKEDIWDGVLTSTLTGAASGALAASGVGLAGQIIGGAAIAMAGNATQQTIDILQDEKESFSVGEMLVDGAVGAVGGLIGGAGASQGNTKTAMTLGKQVTRRVFVKHEVAKGLSYYGKNMMNGAGQSIYKQLGKAIIKSGGSSLAINSLRITYQKYRG